MKLRIAIKVWQSLGSCEVAYPVHTVIRAARRLSRAKLTEQLKAEVAQFTQIGIISRRACYY